MLLCAATGQNQQEKIVGVGLGQAVDERGNGRRGVAEGRNLPGGRDEDGGVVAAAGVGL